jgi:hypothetical protein
MPFLAACPSCKKTFDAPDQAAGRKVRCPHCTTLMRLPTMEEIRVLTSPVPEAIPTDSPAKRKPTATKKLLIVVAALFSLFVALPIGVVWLSRGTVDLPVLNQAKSDKDAIKKYVLENANDPSSVEFLEFSKPSPAKLSFTPSPQSRQVSPSELNPWPHTVEVKLRARNRLGALMVDTTTFCLSEDGRVLSVQGQWW